MIKFGNKDKKKTAGDDSAEAAQEGTAVDLLNSLQGGPEQRSIMFVGEINEEKTADLISALLVLSQQKEEKEERAEDIKIYISTYGGSADEMFGVYDIMNHCKQFCDIETIGFGKVMSAGTLLLAAGTKGKRKLGKHGGSIGELHNLENEMEQMKALQDNYIQCLSSETQMTKRQIQTLINRKISVYFSAEEAIEKGLADGVL